MVKLLIQIGYQLALLQVTNCENVPQLETTEVILVDFNVANKDD